MDTNYSKKIYEQESIVDYYDKIAHKFQLFKSEKIMFEKYVDKKNKILDIGCGAGRTTIGLYNLGYLNIVGIDISSKMIEKAKENCTDIEFKEVDVINMPFEDNYFDTAFFSFNGLMLLPKYENRLKAIKEIKRVIKKNSIFIFSTPYLDNKLEYDFWANRVKNSKIDINEESFGDIYLDDMGVEKIYLHMPFISEIKEMLESAKFEILEVKRRVDVTIEEQFIEEELDDNLIWIVRS